MVIQVPLVGLEGDGSLGASQELPGNLGWDLRKPGERSGVGVRERWRRLSCSHTHLGCIRTPGTFGASCRALPERALGRAPRDT